MTSADDVRIADDATAAWFAVCAHLLLSHSQTWRCW